MYLIIYIFILIITNKTTNMNYYAQQLELVAIDVGVDKTLPQSEFITAKKVIEKFNELKKENAELQYMLKVIQDSVETLQSCTPSVANEADLQLILDIINGDIETRHADLLQKK